MSESPTLSIAHSPDTDDYFFFWALRNGLVDARGLNLRFAAYHTEELNRRALAHKDDLIAISVAVYPQIKRDYDILPQGASIGRNYGPVLVALKNYERSELNGLHIAVPGKTTTARAVLKLVAPNARTKVIPIEPFEGIFTALESGEVDAALLIHEGQIAFRERGLDLLLDLGAWWKEETDCPLPLGVNVIRRALDPQVATTLAEVSAESVQYAFDHREELISALSDFNRLRGAGLTAHSDIDRYLSMYANDDSKELEEEVICGISMLMEKIKGL